MRLKTKADQGMMVNSLSGLDSEVSGGKPGNLTHCLKARTYFLMKSPDHIIDFETYHMFIVDQMEKS
jgi:hypothetical protein